MRREWIAGQACDVGTSRLTLRSDDLIRLDEHDLPRQLENVAVPDGSRPLQEMGALIVLIERTPDFSRRSAPAEDFTRTDSLIFRRARPVTLGVYRKSPEGTWDLDESLTANFDIVDRHSDFDVLDFEGHWFTKRTIALEFHPDQSVKTYSVGSASTVSALTDAVGSALTSASSGATDLVKVPSAEQRQLDQSKQKLELLKTADDYAQLAATHDRSAELAEIEQRAKFADAAAKLGPTRPAG